MKARRYETLDGMRGLCALIVATFHCDLLLHTGHLLNHGWLSVDIFFVISGFVIAHVYEQRLLAGGSMSEFMRARARRLIPTQLIGTALAAAAYIALFASGRLHDHITWSAMAVATAFALLLLPMAFSAFGRTFTVWNASYPISPPLWSLQGEWVINFVYARWLFSARVKTLATLFVVLSIYLFYGATHLLKPIAFLPATVLSDLARASAGFIAGVLVFRANTKGVIWRLPRISPLIVYGLWFFVCAMPTVTPTPVLEMTVSLIVSPLLVSLLVRNERPMPKVSLRLGTLSYPLYASHFSVINLMSIWLRLSPVRHSALLAIPMLAAALSLAFGIDRLTAALWSGARLAQPAKQAA